MGNGSWIELWWEYEKRQDKEGTISIVANSRKQNQEDRAKTVYFGALNFG